MSRPDGGLTQVLLRMALNKNPSAATPQATRSCAISCHSSVPPHALWMGPSHLLPRRPRKPRPSLRRPWSLSKWCDPRLVSLCMASRQCRTLATHFVGSRWDTLATWPTHQHDSRATSHRGTLPVRWHPGNVDRAMLAPVQISQDFGQSWAGVDQVWPTRFVRFAPRSTQFGRC